MASISTTITAVDRMSGPLRQIYQNARILRNELETIGRLSSLNNVGASMNNLTRNVVNNVNIINLQLNQVNNNIRDAFNSSVVNNFNQQVREGQSAVGGFEGKIRSLVGAYIGLRGIQKLVGLFDALASSSAKLSVIVDDKGSIADMDRKIFASAQRSKAS